MAKAFHRLRLKGKYIGLAAALCVTSTHVYGLWLKFLLRGLALRRLLASKPYSHSHLRAFHCHRCQKMVVGMSCFYPSMPAKPLTPVQNGRGIAVESPRGGWLARP
jgi:hypothetical protein